MVFDPGSTQGCTPEGVNPPKNRIFQFLSYPIEFGIKISGINRTIREKYGKNSEAPLGGSVTSSIWRKIEKLTKIFFPNFFIFSNNFLSILHYLKKISHFFPIFSSLGCEAPKSELMVSPVVCLCVCVSVCEGHKCIIECFDFVEIWYRSVWVNVLDPFLAVFR